MTTMKNYIIKYSVYDKIGSAIKNGTMRVKRKSNSIDAQIKLEEFFKRKYDNFGRLVVYKCDEENPLFGLFGYKGVPWD